MKRKIHRFVQKRLVSPITHFIKDSRAVGIVLIVATVVSMLLSNRSGSAYYIHFWEQSLFTSFYGLHLPHTALHLINDGLMALFFLLVGLEIKRELLIGELASLKKSMLPIVAAIGGMVIPVCIYFLWCGNTPFQNGWGIPMATDIAFSLGVLSLLGKKIPLSLKIFLTALAIIDDLGGILLIALFYAGDLQFLYLGLAAGVTLILVLLQFFKITHSLFYCFLGILLWYFIFNSGVHASIAGVILAFTIPIKKIGDWEHRLHLPVNFTILPLFALANTAIPLPDDWSSVLSSSLHHGIFMGLLLGKPIGIFLFSYIAIQLKIAEKPEHLAYKNLIGIGIIAGIGFTMSIFISSLAFADDAAKLVAKIAILSASLLAAIVGLIYLNSVNRNTKPTTN
jgi:NhaA family Na+:H+ antiporter